MKSENNLQMYMQQLSKNVKCLTLYNSTIDMYISYSIKM